MSVLSLGPDDGPVVLYAEFTARPGREEEVALLLLGLTAQVRREPGNIRFDPFRLRTNPAAFFVYEAYTDAAAFTTHLAADYGAAFNTALQDLIEGDGSDLTWLTPLA